MRSTDFLSYHLLGLCKIIVIFFLKKGMECKFCFVFLGRQDVLKEVSRRQRLHLDDKLIGLFLKSDVVRKLLSR